jgi:lysine N6-hydroxylase
LTPEPARADLAGIGIGPFNLSLAALASGVEGLSSAFFERRPAFAWHPGLGFRDSVLQTSFLKDLVTPVRPTSPWSFLNYLVTHGRFYDFLAGRFSAVSREEFTDYMRWVAARLPSCRFGEEIVAVEQVGRGFRMHLSGSGEVRARALSVGTGQAPNIPEGAPLCADCLHVSAYLGERPALGGRRVALIGGGQSGAEVFLNLLSSEPAPVEIIWLSRREAFWHLQEGGLVDQIFTPAYQSAYRTMPERAREHALAAQKYTSDGLTPATADAIYAALYCRRHLEGRRDASLRPWRDVTRISRRQRGFRLTARTGWGELEELDADVVLLATGYRPSVPACLEPLGARLAREPDGSLRLGENYRVLWDGPDEMPIYALNHGRRSYGVIDPQLSMAAWRSAVILNDLMGRKEFDLEPMARAGLLDWAERPSQPESLQEGMTAYAAHACAIR